MTNAEFFFFAFGFVFTGAVVMLVPYFTPRRYFFTVTVDSSFPNSSAGREIMRHYHRQAFAILLSGAAAGAALWFVSAGAAFGAILVTPLLSIAIPFLRARNRVSRYAAPANGIREADLDHSGDHLPRWIAAALPALAIPPAVAAYLNSHWNEIPSRFPVHWGADGQPNRWVEKSAHAIYGPVLFGSAMMLLMLFLGLTTFYGARRAPQRAATLKILIGCVYCFAVMFPAIALQPLLHFSPAVFIVPALIFGLVVTVWSYRFLRAPGRKVEATPDANWHLGQIYYNPQDPALFVQKRLGLGYTLNFGNRTSWLMIGALAAFMAGMVFLLP